jgi:hypothetical protein
MPEEPPAPTEQADLLDVASSAESDSLAELVDLSPHHAGAAHPEHNDHNGRSHSPDLLAQRLVFFSPHLNKYFCPI